MTALQIYRGGKVRGNDDMCFYGQTSIAGGAVRLKQVKSPRFDVDLEKVPSDVEKIVITATTEGGKTFGQLSGVNMDVSVHTLSIPGQGRSEAALILAEIYKRNGAWKVRNVGQGFNGGLAQLATHLDVEIAEEKNYSPAPAAAPNPATSVNLSKVTLTKAGDRSRISLDKAQDGIVRVSATWIEHQSWVLNVSFDGPPVFKKGRGIFGRILGADGPKYANP